MNLDRGHLKSTRNQYSTDIKVALVKSNITQKELALALGYKYENNFSTALALGRVKTKERRDEILNVIKTLERRKKNES